MRMGKSSSPRGAVEGLVRGVNGEYERFANRPYRGDDGSTGASNR